jgi:hypothetical protein
MTRAELVLLFLGLFLLALAAMWWGWRNRAKGQSGLPELPAVPNELGVDQAPQLTGLYVGTTVATEWQNRIVARGLGQRADSVARVTSAGVVIERQGSGPIFIPSGQLLDARLEPALAGKVVGKGGLLVLRWQHGDLDLDTGLRADDRTVYPAWVRAIQTQGVIGG